MVISQIVLILAYVFSPKNLTFQLFGPKNVKTDQEIKISKTIDPYDCGRSSDKYVYQFLVPGSDLMLERFFDF